MKMQDLNETVAIKATENPTVNTTTTLDTPYGQNYWYIKDLPSKYRLYSEGTKIYGRPLKVLDIKYLSTIDSENYDQIINDIIKKCTRGIDINKILICDKLYIIFWLRANTYKDSGCSVEFKCSKCSEQSTYNFDLDALNVISIKDEYDPNKEIELPISKTTLKIGHQTIGDEIIVEDFINKNETSITKYNKDILQIASVIEIINNEKPESLKKTYEAIAELDARDYAFLESYIKHIDIGVSPVLNVKCNKCGGPTLTGVTFSGDFFVPKYKFE